MDDPPPPPTIDEAGAAGAPGAMHLRFTRKKTRPPRVLRRASRTYILILFGGMAVYLVGSWVRVTLWPKYGLSVIAVVPAGLYVTCMAISACLAFRTHRRLRHALKRSDGLLCLECAHDLTGLDDPGRCPECGVPFEAAETRRQWRKHLPYLH